MQLTYFLPILLILAMFGAGCKQSSSEQRTTNNDPDSIAKSNIEFINPCEMLDKSEVDALFGMESEIIQNDLEPQNTTGQKLCVYDIPSDDAVKMVQIGVRRTRDMGGDMTTEVLFESQKEFLDNAVDVANLGEASYQSKMDFVGGGALYTLTDNGATLITVDVSLGQKDHEANQKTERDLMKNILDNY